VSYRDEAQALSDRISSLSSAIDGFCDAVLARVKSQEWQGGHIEDLVSLAETLRRSQVLLLRIQRDTW